MGFGKTPCTAKNRDHFNCRAPAARTLALLLKGDNVDGVLRLLEAPEDAAWGDKGLQGWSCPIGVAPEVGQETDMERLLAAFKREVAELRPWYDLGLEERKRTAVVEFDPQSSSELLSGFLTGGKPLAGQKKFSLALALRLAAQDLKAFYFEAATARPGSASPSSGEFNRWFWQDTAAGRILKAVKERCMQESDESLKKTGAMLLVPLDQA